MVIKILGTGCKKCKKLEENVLETVKELGLDASVVKVDKLEDIMAYGVMSTPALVIDEKVVSYGKVLNKKDLISILNK